MNHLVRPLAAAAFAIAALGGSAHAQQQQAAGVQLEASERDALRPLYAAFQQRNWGAFAAALPAAKSAVRSAQGRYYLGQLLFQMGLYSQNMAAQAEGIETMLASGAAPPDQMRGLLLNQAALAMQAGAPERAEPLMERAAEANPADPEILGQLAEIKLMLARDPARGGNAERRAAKQQEALALYGRALQAAAARPQPLPESFYRRAAALGFEAGSAPLATLAGRQLVAHYPSPINWRDVLLQLRDLHPNDPELALDAGRLMLRTGALGGERDYFELAQALLAAGRAIEAKSVLDRGVEAGMIAASESEARDLIARVNRAATAERSGLAARRTRARSAASGAEARAVGDTLLGQSEHAEAATFYRLALEKGAEDPHLVNSRLGLALALAGQPVEADAALNLVTGPRQALAAYIRAWLERRTP